MTMVYFWIGDVSMGYKRCYSMAEAEGLSAVWVKQEGKGAWAEVTTGDITEGNEEG